MPELVMCGMEMLSQGVYMVKQMMRQMGSLVHERTYSGLAV